MKFKIGIIIISDYVVISLLLVVLGIVAVFNVIA